MKVINIIVIDGKEVDIKDLPEEKRIEIANRLSDTFMRKLGYERTEDKTA